MKLYPSTKAATGITVALSPRIGSCSVERTIGSEICCSIYAQLLGIIRKSVVMDIKEVLTLVLCIPLVR